MYDDIIHVTKRCSIKSPKTEFTTKICRLLCFRDYGPVSLGQLLQVGVYDHQTLTANLADILTVIIYVQVYWYLLAF